MESRQNTWRNNKQPWPNFIFLCISFGPLKTRKFELELSSPNGGQSRVPNVNKTNPTQNLLSTLTVSWILWWTWGNHTFPSFPTYTSLVSLLSALLHQPLASTSHPPSLQPIIFFLNHLDWSSQFSSAL